MTVMYTDLPECDDCDDLQWPDPETRSYCVPVKPDYVSWRTPVGMVLTIVALMGLLLTLFTFLLFVIQRKHPLIKASSRELMYTILASITTSYAFTILFVIEVSCLQIRVIITKARTAQSLIIMILYLIFQPNNAICRVRLLGFALIFTAIYGSLMLKTLRIYRVFEAGQRAARPSYASNKTQLSMVSTIILIHVSHKT